MCENASLEDLRTKMVDTSERSMPRSKVDRSNITATCYRCVYTYKSRGLLRTWMGKGAAGRNHAAPTCLREEDQPGGASRRGGGKETLQEIQTRPHVGPSSRSVPGQITHGRGAAQNA